MKKAAVIGQYGTGPQHTTGQAVNTGTITDLLIRKYGKDNVETVNSFGWKKHPVSLMLKVLAAMSRCENVIVLPAQNGEKVFIPLISISNVLFRRKTFYIVVGSWLTEMLARRSVLKRFLNTFSGRVYAQSAILKENLEMAGVRNARYLPNCRDSEAAEKEDLFPLKDENGMLHIGTWSRVTEEKGIEDAVTICRKANEMLGKDNFRLDVYGLIDPDYREKFNSLRDSFPETVSYRGVKNADEGISTVKTMFVLLFPTHYEGECIAGTVLDAFNAQTPVIANDRKYNNEIIRNGVNGILFHFRNTAAAAVRLVKLYSAPEFYRKIQAGCRKSAEKNDTDSVLQVLEKELV